MTRPPRADIGATDVWLSGDQFEAVACLVNPEQRATQRDLA
jgi:hypothetical protein